MEYRVETKAVHLARFPGVASVVAERCDQALLGKLRNYL